MATSEEILKLNKITDAKKLQLGQAPYRIGA
jgi:hypothetical protein